jgi:hypothetical protein
LQSEDGVHGHLDGAAAATAAAAAATAAAAAVKDNHPERIMNV